MTINIRDLRERGHFEDPGVDGRVILNGSSRRGMVRHGLDCYGSGKGQMAGACECGNEPWGSIK